MPQLYDQRTQIQYSANKLRRIQVLCARPIIDTPGRGANQVGQQLTHNVHRDINRKRAPPKNVRTHTERRRSCLRSVWFVVSEDLYLWPLGNFYINICARHEAMHRGGVLNFRKLESKIAHACCADPRFDGNVR